MLQQEQRAASTGNRLHVITWLHLEDSEEYGDEYEDGSPLPWTREVWKRVEIGPWCYGPESLSRSVPVTEPEGQALLGMPDAALEEAIYSRLGVRSREAKPGLPKGPYFDPISITAIRQELRIALETYGEAPEPGKDLRGEAVHREVIQNLERTLVEEVLVEFIESRIIE